MGEDTRNCSGARRRAAGVDGVHVGDIDYAAATDASILALADQQGRVVVTLDADIHHLLA